MSISNIQSGYDTGALAPQNARRTSKSSPIAPDILPAAGAAAAGAKGENPAASKAAFTRPLFSSQANAVLLRQQETGSSGLHDVANRYDVTNLSGHERGAMAQELRDKGLISAGTHLAMAAPLSMNEDLAAKTNYLDTARKAYDFAAQHGASTDQLAIQKDRLDILAQLQAFRS